MTTDIRISPIGAKLIHPHAFIIEQSENSDNIKNLFCDGLINDYSFRFIGLNGLVSEVYKFICSKYCIRYKVSMS